jgi:hypothetical protein
MTSTSTENNMTLNNVSYNGVHGVLFDAASGTNELDGNWVCFNVIQDINNSDNSNNGTQDHCDYWYNWEENEHYGCTYSCSEFWHRFYGNGTGDIYLTDNDSGTTSYMYHWNGTPYNIYFTDYDSVIDWNDLQAIGRTDVGGASTDDFIELDNAFNGTHYPDNITYTYSTDGSAPKTTRSYDVYHNSINNVPIANSTTNSTFKTGILWDMSDGGTQYTNTINQSTVWVVEVNQSIEDVYGEYDFLGSIPYTLATYEGSNDLISVYVEIR